VAKPLWDWQVFQPLAASYGAKTVRLSGDSLALFLCTEGLTELDRWASGDSDPTEAEADDIEALTALAYTELMGNALIGTIAPYMTASPPAGMLACDGTHYLRVDYPDLYAALDSAFIVDADHFATPDLRGRVPLGAGTGTGLSTYASGDAGGQENHALTTAELAVHNHGLTDPGHIHSLSDAGHIHTITDPGHGHSLNNPTHTHGLTDPGHIHTVTDPGHTHSVPHGAGTTTNGITGATNIATAPATNTGSQTTGVTVDNHTTGASVNAAAANQTANNATTGVTVNSHNTGATVDNHTTGMSVNNSGSGTAHENRQPYLALKFGVWAQ